MSPSSNHGPCTEALFTDQARYLMERLRSYSTQELATIMGLSPRLASETEVVYKTWGLDKEKAGPALFAYAGAVYNGIDALTLPSHAITRAKESLRIVSGLYGLLRPTDEIFPYRLEMALTLPGNTHGGPEHHDTLSLQQFWARQLKGLFAKGETVVNLCSSEYTRVFDFRGLRVITPRFEDFIGGKYKVVSYHAKRARGMFARHLLLHTVTGTDEELHESCIRFHGDSYCYEPALSSPESPLYRPMPTA